MLYIGGLLSQFSELKIYHSIARFECEVSRSDRQMVLQASHHIG
ncbi:Uncharacterised protein [Vibrio cholerae]|nr:Uncharacterised protein [Vibrio cholerae]